MLVTSATAKKNFVTVTDEARWFQISDALKRGSAESFMVYSTATSRTVRGLHTCPCRTVI